MTGDPGGLKLRKAMEEDEVASLDSMPRKASWSLTGAGAGMTGRRQLLDMVFPVGEVLGQSSEAGMTMGSGVAGAQRGRG